MDNNQIEKLLADFDVWPIEENKKDSYHDVCHSLYKAYLNKFNIEMTQKEYILMDMYREKVFDLVNALHDSSSTIVSDLLVYLLAENAYLVDLILMCWCLPKKVDYYSKKRYQAVYQENIKKYNHIIIGMIEIEPIKIFCTEILTKTCNVPIHCLDYIWYYVNDSIHMEFHFINSVYNDYITINFQESEDKKIIELDIGIDIYRVLELGLGSVDAGNGKMFKQVIKVLVKSDSEEIYSKSFCKENYLSQLKAIREKYPDFFD